jgi:hypothetical protein
MKKCIICDKFVRDQREAYTANHYLCSGFCVAYYMQCVIWNNGRGRVKIDIDILNEIRRETMGIDILMRYEVDRRID